MKKTINVNLVQVIKTWFNSQTYDFQTIVEYKEIYVINKYEKEHAIYI